jgi:integrating conjugative element protein (TIGR03755 family)
MRPARRRPAGLVLAAVAVATVAVAAAAPARAEGPVVGNRGLYYRIGGGLPISPPAGGKRRITVGFNLASGIRLPQACSKLDPMISLQAMLHNVVNAADEAEALMVSAANATIAALPAIILQRANPGLYAHLMSVLARLRAMIELAHKSCEQMVEDARQGKSPFEDWIQITRREAWGQQITAGGQGPVEAKQAVDDQAGNAGAPWLGGNRGGAGQPPIAVIGDTVLAGYNLLLGRQPTDSAPAPAAAAPRLVILWPNPPDAVAYANRVLGEERVRTCQGCTPTETVPGTGILPEYEEVREAITAQLQAFVDGAGALTNEGLEAVSASGIMITRELVEAVRDLPEDADRALIVGRLAADAAIARTVEQALALRRMLLSGQRVPEIGGSQPAAEHIRHAIAEVDKEIESLLYENDVRKRLLSGTAEAVLGGRHADEKTSAQQPPKAEQGDRLLRGKVDP